MIIHSLANKVKVFHKTMKNLLKSKRPEDLVFLNEKGIVTFI